MWLQLLWLLIIAGLGALAFVFSDYLFMIVVGGICAVVIFWVLGCIFTPAIPNRHCPKCSKEGLVKIKKGEPSGVRCEHCDFVDTEMYVAFLDEW